MIEKKVDGTIAIDDRPGASGLEMECPDCSKPMGARKMDGVTMLVCTCGYGQRREKKNS